MANTYIPEAIDGGDAGIWGDKELGQNRASKGVISCQLYDDSGTLKLTLGRINFDNDSGNGTVNVDTVTTIDISGITNSRWFTVELTRIGTAPTFTAVELATDTNPYDLPASIESYYDPEKGGYYRISTARIIGFGWKATGGSLAGILNLESVIEGYAGYSTGEIIGHVYRWDKRINNTYDSAYAGKFYLLADSDRPANWILNNGTQTSWTDVDFSAYIPVNAKSIYIKYWMLLTGDGAKDSAQVYLRKNGSSETDTDKLIGVNVWHTNAAAGFSIGQEGALFVECGTDGIVEYILAAAGERFYMALMGYTI